MGVIGPEELGDRPSLNRSSRTTNTSSAKK